MFKIGSYRAMAIVFALAALAFTANGVPDNKGPDAAIGWSGFLALMLMLLVLARPSCAAFERGGTARAHPSTVTNEVEGGHLSGSHCWPPSPWRRP
jgi:hypothetical protein